MDSAAERTTLAQFGNSGIVIANITKYSSVPNTATMASARMIPGKAMNTSTKRCSRMSTLPPKKALVTPTTIPPAVANKITNAMLAEIQRLMQAGKPPVILASPQVRAQVRKLVEPHLPNAAVLGYNEVCKGVAVESVGLVHLDTAAESQADIRTPQGAAV